MTFRMCKCLDEAHTMRQRLVILLAHTLTIRQGLELR